MAPAGEPLLQEPVSTAHLDDCSASVPARSPSPTRPICGGPELPASVRTQSQGAQQALRVEGHVRVDDLVRARVDVDAELLTRSAARLHRVAGDLHGPRAHHEARRVVMHEVQLTLRAVLRDGDVLIVGEREDLRAQKQRRDDEDERERAEDEQLRTPAEV